MYLAIQRQNTRDIGSFIPISKIKGIKKRRDRNKKHQFFFAKSISKEAKQYHREFKNHENKEPKSSKGFYLINIHGLITKKENKIEILRNLVEPRTNRKVIETTERHLSPAQLCNAEIS